MASGGDLPARGLRHALPVGECLADVDLGQQFRRVEPPEATLGDPQHLPDQDRGVGCPREPLRCPGPQPDRCEGTLDDVDGPEGLPVRLGERVEGDYPLPSGQERADGLWPVLEEWQGAALQAPLNPPHAGPAHRDCPRLPRPPPGLAVPVAIAGRRIDSGASLKTDSPQHGGDLFLQLGVVNADSRCPQITDLGCPLFTDRRVPSEGAG